MIRVRDSHLMPIELIEMVNNEVHRGYQKWGRTDTHPAILLNAATEELGEVAHAINHDEGQGAIQQEIAETMGILTRLFDMVIDYYEPV